ncbi:MAG: 4Fe-4S ferredoxin, partial [Bacteroidales bacterium]|nr:4Fe-4S ferredoxin [Bacteroidales bacterium]
MIFYYSGCGNSRWVAKEIAAATSDQLLFIPEVTQREFNIEEKSVGFVFPIYSWAAPLLVEQFILSCKWHGTPQYVWFACTCGDNIGYAYEKFSKTLKKAGLMLDSGFTIQMPNTYLLMKGFHLDSPELTDQKLQAAKAKLPSLISDIKSHKKGVKDVIKGRYAFTKTYIIRPGFVKNATDKKFYTE